MVRLMENYHTRVCSGGNGRGVVWRRRCVGRLSVAVHGPRTLSCSTRVPVRLRRRSPRSWPSTDMPRGTSQPIRGDSRCGPPSTQPPPPPPCGPPHRCRGQVEAVAGAAQVAANRLVRRRIRRSSPAQRRERTRDMLRGGHRTLVDALSDLRRSARSPPIARTYALRRDCCPHHCPACTAPAAARATRGPSTPTTEQIPTASTATAIRRPHSNTIAAARDTSPMKPFRPQPQRPDLPPHYMQPLHRQHMHARHHSHRRSTASAAAATSAAASGVLRSVR